MVPEYGFLLPLSAWPDALYISSPLSIQQNGHASRPGPLCPASLLDCRQNLTNTELTLDIPDCIDPFLIQNIDHSASNLSIHPKIETSSAEPTTLRNVPSDTLDDWQGCPAVSASHIQVPTPELSKRRSSSVSSVLERHTLPSSNPDVERMLWEEWLGHATPDIVTKHESADTSSNSNHVDHWTACATFRHHARQRRAVFSLSQKIQQPNDSDMEIDSDTSDAPDALPWLQDGDELVRPFGTSSSGLKSAWAEKQMERCLSEARVIVSRDKQRGDVLATNEECRAREQHAQEFINNARRSPRKKAKKEQRHPALPLSPSQSCKKVESVSTALVVFGQRLDPPPSQGRRISHRHNELAEPLLQMPYPHPQPPRKRTSTPRTEAKTSMQPVGETPELSGASHDRKSEKRPRKRQRVGRASSSRSLRLQRPSQEMQPVASTSSAASLATPGDEISHVSSSTTGADAMSLIDPIFNEPEYLATTQVVLSQKPAQLTAPSQSQYSLQTEHTQSESSLAQSTNTSSKGKRPTRGLIPEPVAEDRFGPPIQHRKSHNSCSSRLDEQERANDKLDSTVVALPHSQALVPVSLPLIDPDLLGEIWSTQSPSLLADQKAPRVMSPGVSSALSSVGTSTTGPSRTSLRDKWTKRPRKRAKPLPRVRFEIVPPTRQEVGARPPMLRRGKRRRIMLEVGSYLGQLALPAPPEQPTRSRQSTFKEGPPPPPVTPERNLFDVASGQWLPEQTSLQRHFLQMMDSPVSQVPSRTPSPNASTQTTNTGPTTFDMEDIFDGIISPIPPSWMQQDSPPISGGSEAPGSQSEEHRRQQADVDVTMASSTSFNSLVIDLTLNDCELKDSSSCPQSHSTPAANFNDGDGDDEEVQLIYGSASFSDSWHPQQFMLPLAPNPTLDIV